MPINTCNDQELCDALQMLDFAYHGGGGFKSVRELWAEGNADGLWIAIHRLTNAGEKAKERLNRIKYDKKEAA